MQQRTGQADQACSICRPRAQRRHARPAARMYVVYIYLHAEDRLVLQSKLLGDRVVNMGRLDASLPHLDACNICMYITYMYVLAG